MPRQLVLCDCEGTQTVDRELLENKCGVSCSRVHTALCTREISAAADLMGKGDSIFACQQETAVFDELAAELDVEPPRYVDIRDRAGWTADSSAAGPKMAAIMADALLEVPPVKSIDVQSEGLCLILGSPDVAFPAALQLCEVLGVTVLVEGNADIPPDRRFEVVRGELSGASGSLGNFKVRIRNLQQLQPGGRGDFVLGVPVSSGQSECDLILDLSGKPPLFPAPGKREGYLRADPGDPLAVQRVVFEISHLTGMFEQPLYVSFDQHLCAHSRAQKTACTRCLDTCPTGAISSAGDHVAVDPMICAGCGACSSVCPSGAVSYELPPAEFLFRRLETLSRVFRDAGGGQPRLLVHDEDHGSEMISLCARYGRGLPSSVIPLAIESITCFGHAEMLAAVATGFASVDLLVSPRTERGVLERECALALAIMDQPRVRMLDVHDPEALSDVLFGFEAAEPVADTVFPLGGRREVTRISAKALNPDMDEPIALPEGAPYGAIVVDTEACTLCLSCASLCPSGAIGDNPELPQLRFQEDACLQCGLCANICPENAITLQPQLDLSDAALGQRVVKEEEPYSCIECGAPFGVKSTVERIVSRLEGKHSMFTASDAGRLIRMCDDCRIKAQYHSRENPMQMGERPIVRTTADYMNGKGRN
ncbi:MAG: 4Fe-4S binding protein [Rhodobacteraceae bacterium]|nr:4Fe-4S binding protein [Paracoccaceae bacterium]MCY4139357.1 4Fe-4S binding protein [Paracoccaceae bacterium]